MIKAKTLARLTGMVVKGRFASECRKSSLIGGTRESIKGVMTVRKYSFLLANSSQKYKWELYVLAKNMGILS